MFEEPGDEAGGLFDIERGAGANAVGFKRFVPAFDLAVGLGVVGGDFYMGEPGDADEFLEVFGDEPGAVVTDDAGLGRGEFFQGALEDDFNVGLCHGLAQFEVNDGARASAQEGAEVVKGAGDVDVGDIDVPVLVGAQRLLEARAFLAGLCVPCVDESGGFEHAVGARGADGDGITVEHHEGEAATVAFERELVVKVDDGAALPILEPFVAGDEAVVLVGFAVALTPVVILGAADAQPFDEPQGPKAAALAAPCLYPDNSLYE